MKDIRPSTWVLLGVMLVLIFAPLFLLDIDPLQAPGNGAGPLDNGPGGPIHPHDPKARDKEPPANQPPANQPAANQPAANKPEPDVPADGAVE